MHSILRVLIFFAAFIFASHFALAQDREQSDLYMEQAKLIMNETKAMDDARDLMVIAANSDSTNIEANFDAGRFLMLTIGKERASKYFLRVFRQAPNYRFDIEYWIGQSFQFGLDFGKAIEYYELYQQKLRKRADYSGRDKIPVSDVDRRIVECKNGQEFVANPKPFSIVNIGREINSEFDDYAPVLNESETELVFTSRRRDGNVNADVFEDNKPYEDIFYAVKENGKWKRASNIGSSINTQFHDSNLALSSDGKTLFIRKDVNGGDIYFCTRQADGSWSSPEPLEGDVNSSFTEASVSITKDGKTMYFSSDRPGGLGGTDIYVTTKNNAGEWSKVKNLGPKINTPDDEDSPFIDYDSKTLYFSSKAGKGMGGFDIFKSNLLDAKKNEWSDPENLGYPINTPDNDIYYVGTKDGKGYYSSTRENGLGYEDIYFITTNPPKDEKPVEKLLPLNYIVKILDKESKQPLDASASLTAVPDQESVAARTMEPGTIEFQVNNPKAQDYQLSVSMDGYISQNLTVHLEGASVLGGSDGKLVELIREDEKPVEKKVSPLVYNVRVVDADSKQPLAAKVSLLGVDKKTIDAKKKELGSFDFQINPAVKDYQLSAEMDGYIFQTIKVQLPGTGKNGESESKLIELKKLVVGARSILRNIYFDYGLATFKEESYNELNKLENMMKQNAALSIEISGHTDNVSSAPFNLRLSQKRADAVKNFLISKGINKSRITAIGYGEERPIASNDDEVEGRELNRRVEFKVINN